VNLSRLPDNNLSCLKAIGEICTDDLNMSSGYILDMITGGEWFISYYHEDTLIVYASEQNTSKMNEVFQSNVITETGNALVVNVNVTQNQSLVFHNYGHEKPLRQMLRESVQAKNLRYG
jgi:hypothetical protein